MATSKFYERIAMLHTQYLEVRKEEGGTAAGWRDFALKKLEEEKETLAAYKTELIVYGLMKKWRDRPRTLGPDIFSIAGVPIPEFVTRTARGVDYADGDDIESEDEVKFEKVDHRYATVNDLMEQTDIFLVNAARVAARASLFVNARDAAFKRARGDRNVLLRDLADSSAPKGSGKSPGASPSA
jgi:hypothetical protein